MEAALENLKNDTNQNPISSILSPEEWLWIRAGKELRQNLSVVHREVIKELMRTADFEQLKKVLTELKLAEYQVAFYCQKPLKECSLKEVMDGIVYTIKTTNILDTINYTDCGNYYSLEAIHTLHSDNTDATMSFKLFFQNLFEKYGVKTEDKISENSLFMKVYKNSKRSDEIALNRRIVNELSL